MSKKKSNIEYIDIGGTLVTAFQHIGERKEQQDRFLVIARPSPLSETDIARAFDDLNAHVETGLGDLSRDSGTSATIAVVMPDMKVTAANVGDSRVTLFVHNMKDNTVRGFQLTDDDDGSNPEERERLAALGGHTIEGKRLVVDKVGEIGVTAAIGDLAYNPYIRHTPKIKTFDLSDPDYGITPGDEVILCVETDGMHSSGKPADRAMTVEDIAFINTLSNGKSVHEIEPPQMISEFGRVAQKHVKRLRQDIMNALEPQARLMLEGVLEDNEQMVERFMADDLTGAEREIQEQVVSALAGLNDAELDNMTFLSVKLKPGMAGHVLGVFDGHGSAGAAVAAEVRDFLTQRFSPAQT